ncbi:glycosyl hydrolase [Noviherbaspirillum sp.]|uniref:glycosyl hydrolase n=1 Tax=Noviherbaspirillum sp. TaxID=1926288 RepID=UPI002B4A0C1E|nr:glycosyl hydrolase [Noviherbaspirillum sp.]HJV81937.1 glycosyl hydrolase [Noviherbaspirillum sp.]
MIWGGNPDVNQPAATIPDGAKYLLGFNEPNFKAQANKTPSQAASAWWRRKTV